jgi:hypothetical protein
MLDRDVAIELAEVLTDIPNKSRMPGAMKEAVRKLQKWCVGGEHAGCHWTPEMQARWLVEQACTRWNTWQGYGALYSLFLSRFPPPIENTPVETAPAISRDLATQFIRRLESCHGFPIDRQGRAALEKCLMEKASSATVAERVIRECERRRHCPEVDNLGIACEAARLHVDMPSLFSDFLRETPELPCGPTSLACSKLSRKPSSTGVKARHSNRHLP